MHDSGMHDSASLHEFARIGEVAETTTQLLSLGLQHHTTFAGQPREKPRKIDPVEQIVLQQARDLMAQVREGFVLSVRSTQGPSTQGPSMAELRFLLERVLHDWGALSDELGLQIGATEDVPAGKPGEEQHIARLRHQLLAFGMAATALGSLPRTPSEESHFPLQLWQTAHLLRYPGARHARRHAPAHRGARNDALEAHGL